MTNYDIIYQLKILQDYYKKEGDKFRQRAYTTAIYSIKNLPYEIESINDFKKSKIKGIGKSIADKIIEFLTTGQIKKVQEIESKILIKKDSKTDIIDSFLKIWGVGSVKANELYNKGYRSIADIKLDPKLLTKSQRIGLKYYEELQNKINREYITIFSVMLKTIIKKYLSPNFKMDIAGSYRRGMKESNDVDCLISSNKFNLKQLVDTLQKYNIVSDILSIKNEKFMGIAHCPSDNNFYFRFDIEFVPKEEYASALLYFTGSQNFNIMMRQDAKKQGFLLNQHGLFNNKGVLIPTKTEKDIFDILGLNYISPEMR